jgi:thioredoxin-like negative regulator of GroEL
MKKLTLDTFNQEVANNKIILVDFYSNSCPPCKQLKKILDPLSQEMASRLTFAMYNIEDDDGDILDKFEINSIPVLVLLKGGREVARQEGLVSRAELVAWLESGLA